MPLGKRNSTHLAKAKIRLAAIRSINENLDMGKGLSVKAYANMVEKTDARIESYNTAVSTVNAERIAMEEAEQELKEMNERMLLGVAIEFGKDSPQYETAGGVRKSKRKRPSRTKMTQPEEQKNLN